MSFSKIALNEFVSLVYFFKKHLTGFSDVEYLYNSCLPRSNSLPAMVELFVLARKAKAPIVELGAWAGNATVVLAEASARGNKQLVYSIDDHKPFSNKIGGYDDSTECFERNISKTANKYLIKSIYKKDFDAVKTWRKKIWLLLIDTPTITQKKELDDWFKFVEKDGYIVSRRPFKENRLRQIFHYSSFFIYKKRFGWQ